MYDVGLSGSISSLFVSGLTKVIQIGDDNMKKFKYKNNVYVMNDDIKIRCFIKLFNEDDIEVITPTKAGTYIAKEKYEVQKGLYTIETFDTEQEANDFVSKILEEIGD